MTGTVSSGAAGTPSGLVGIARHIPKSVAALVAALETSRAEVVTRASVAVSMDGLSLTMAVDDAVRRLQRLGWLLPLRTQGAWEFAPAARGAALPGDYPFTELSATHLLRPKLGVALAFDKAAMAHGLCPREEREDGALIAARGARRPTALSGFRWITIDLPAGSTTLYSGVPLVTIDALLYTVAARPVGVSDWKTAGVWLQAAVERATPQLLGLVGRLARRHRRPAGLSAGPVRAQRRCRGGGGSLSRPVRAGLSRSALGAGPLLRPVQRGGHRAGPSCVVPTRRDWLAGPRELQPQLES